VERSLTHNRTNSSNSNNNSSRRSDPATQQARTPSPYPRATRGNPHSQGHDKEEVTGSARTTTTTATVPILARTQRSPGRQQPRHQTGPSRKDSALHDERRESPQADPRFDDRPVGGTNLGGQAPQSGHLSKHLGPGHCSRTHGGSDERQGDARRATLPGTQRHTNSCPSTRWPTPHHTRGDPDDAEGLLLPRRTRRHDVSTDFSSHMDSSGQASRYLGPQAGGTMDEGPRPHQHRVRTGEDEEIRTSWLRHGLHPSNGARPASPTHLQGPPCVSPSDTSSPPPRHHLPGFQTQVDALQAGRIAPDTAQRPKRSGQDDARERPHARRDSADNAAQDDQRPHGIRAFSGYTDRQSNVPRIPGALLTYNVTYIPGKPFCRLPLKAVITATAGRITFHFGSQVTAGVVQMSCTPYHHRLVHDDVLRSNPRMGVKIVVLLTGVELQQE